MIFSRPVSAEDIEFAITQLYNEADTGAISYSVGKGVSQILYYVNIASAVYGVYSMGADGNPAASSQNMMLVGPNGEGYIIEGLTGMPIYLIPGTTIAFFEEGNKENTEEDSEERVYKPNDGKHKGSAQGDISADLFWNNEAAGQDSLNNAYSSKNTKQLYNVYNDKLVKFQPDNAGTWHAYEVINPAEEVPTDVLRNMKNDGLITNSQYNKWIKGK